MGLWDLMGLIQFFATNCANLHEYFLFLRKFAAFAADFLSTPRIPKESLLFMEKFFYSQFTLFSQFIYNYTKYQIEHIFGDDAIL
ncbi:hypothetical protein MNBD_CHLOROFLEXI01-4379 [hydrothermal vent metagenome]|uniref:Uncharacterized protein n=1 Tax=hydrothermal vent metagenome TaxID=652676 RepID=A0A3B0W723_9ZZZZ